MNLCRYNLLLLSLLVIILAACDKNAEENIPETKKKNIDVPFFYSQRLYASGDYQSQGWRIPVLLCTDKGVLLAINDKRKENINDLPNNIDIVCRRSYDNGRTWSAPSYIFQAQGIEDGCGDPAIVQAANGDIICAYVGDNGTVGSTTEKPINSYITISKDQGETWGERRKITSLIWGEEAERPECKIYSASFFSSGNGLRLKRGKNAGRIMFVASLFRKKTETDIFTEGDFVTDCFVVYSDDNGINWHVSKRAFSGGNEAKMVELVDERILMSIRLNGSKKRAYAYSNDGGITWGETGIWDDILTTDCNGDLIRYSAVDEGAENNVLLQSLPNYNDRYRVGVFLSLDEGKTWKGPALLFWGWSAYSSLTVLSDKTIGAYIEQYGYEHNSIELWYMNFSYSWLISQALPN